MTNAADKTARLVTRQAKLDEIVDLRWAILRQGLPREAAIFQGDDHPTALHVAALCGDRVVGCATLHSSEFIGRHAWQLRGMAVEKDFQGLGVGRRLLQLLDDLLARGGRPPRLWCNAREPAVAFYQRLGWKVISDRFHIETAGPHFKMSRLPAEAPAPQPPPLSPSNERPGSKH